MIDKIKSLKFREFTTSLGTEVLAGKNAEQNELLMKSFVGKENLIFHTAKVGSPFCVILDIVSVKKTDIIEVAIFCASKSKDWRDNKNNVLVHFFKGKDVYKDKKMKTGTFGVRKFKELRVKKSEIENFISKTIK